MSFCSFANKFFIWSVYIDDDIPNGFPKFSLQPNMQGVEKGRNALIPCKVSGNPEPAVTWLKDTMPLDTTKPRISIYQGASLQIQNAQEEDQGQYECVAANSVGTAYSDMATLYVRSKFTFILLGGSPNQLLTPLLPLCSSNSCALFFHSP